MFIIPHTLTACPPKKDFSCVTIEDSLSKTVIWFRAKCAGFLPSLKELLTPAILHPSVSERILILLIITITLASLTAASAVDALFSAKNASSLTHTHTMTWQSRVMCGAAHDKLQHRLFLYFKLMRLWSWLQKRAEKGRAEEMERECVGMKCLISPENVWFILLCE